MPQLVTFRVKRPDHRTIRIWVPVLPILLVLSPVVILAVLGTALACHIYHVSAVRALGSAWRFFSALPGTRLDIEESGMALLISIR